MKKILALILTILLIPGICFAKNRQTHKLLDDSSGTSISSYALTSGVAVYSETINLSQNAGFCALLVTENQGGGTGDVDISTEYSVDGTNWYPVYTSDMAGTISADGNIVTALQNSTRWIAYTARIAKYMRYKFDPDANSQITAVHIYVADQ